MVEDLNELLENDNIFDINCSYLDMDNLSLNIHSNSFKIAHLNIHSVPNKFQDLKELLDLLNDKNLLPDIVLMCETFLTERNYTRYSINKFDLVSKYRHNKRGGGVSIMIKSGIKYFERNDLSVFEEGKFESVFIEISRQGKDNIVVGEIYRVPGTNELDFIDEYRAILNKLRSERKKIIIGTDQNLDFLKIDCHTNTMNFFDLNISNNLIPTIHKPTRVTYKSATLIDNIYMDAALLKNAESYIVKTDISDHFMCLAVTQENIVDKRVKEVRRVRKIDENTLRNIKVSLHNRYWDILNTMSVNDGSELLMNEISKVIDFYAPEKDKVINSNNYKQKEPWFTKGLKKSSEQCHRLYKKVVNKPRESKEFTDYKTYRNLFNSIRRKAKSKYYTELIQDNKSDAKKLWRTLNKLTGNIKKKTDINDEIIVNGIRETNSKVISNAFAKYYSEVGVKLARDLESKNKTIDPLLNMRNGIIRSCYFFPTSMAEIEKYIKSLKNKHSKGCDNISNFILKQMYPGILKALEIIFNKSLSEGVFPENMKLAIVKPVYKGKCKSEIINYRPISLLSVISKILEKIVHDRLIKFFEKWKVLYEGQYGYRKGRSTTDAILDFTGNVIENLNKGNYTIGIFLDMSKAFDSINHKTLLRKLEYYGIRGSALEWFKSYFKQRQIVVNYKNKTSDLYQMPYGTPQGSVLGPLLYLIFANDLVKCLRFSNCVTFADDTTVFLSGNNLKFLYRKANEDLRHLSAWFNSNSLTLNAEKSKYILFRTKNKTLNNVSELKISDSEIKRVKHTQFLGVIIDEFLDWELHVKRVLTKLSMGNYSLCMISKCLSFKPKRMIYFANIESHVKYALSVWGPMLKKREIKKLKKLLNKSIRTLCNVSTRKSLFSCYKKARILELADLIELELLKVSFRYVNDTLPARITNLFELANHEHFTRNKKMLKCSIHTSNKYHQSFLGTSPRLWLNLHDVHKNNVKIKSFSKSVSNEKLNKK